MENQELEVKFNITSLACVQRKLLALGAVLEQAEVLETNLRFDTPQADFTRTGQAIRLRQDTRARLTYKGLGTEAGGVRLRQEIEFVVDDFIKARDFLLALGYQVQLVYEKYRTTYQLGGTHVTLDRLPYGDFVEIEGEESEVIQHVAGLLELNWAARLPDSYTVLFARLQAACGFSFNDLTFNNFKDSGISVTRLGIQAADTP